MNDITWTGEHAAEWAQHYGGQVIDLDKPTGCFEVSVWHYQDGLYSVDTDRGLGRCTVWQTDSKDKALGGAEYLEAEGRYSRNSDGEFITNEGEPFTGSIWHDGCSCSQPQTSAPGPS